MPNSVSDKNDKIAEIRQDDKRENISNSDMGAPHRRERIWIVAYSRLQRQTEHEKQTAGSFKCGQNVADTDDTGRERGWAASGMGLLKTNEGTADCRTRQGVNQWSTEPAVGRLVNGLPGRVDRLKGLGNSIIPQIAELLFNKIKNLGA